LEAAWPLQKRVQLIHHHRLEAVEKPCGFGRTTEEQSLD
jgi:hypothetical protein